MSNMLDQAIIDAEALKEVAIKNAEAAIVEKYSDDIKEAVNQLLEQAPPGTPGAPMGMDAGSGETMGKEMEKYPAHVKGENTVHLKLGELMAEMKMDELDPKEKQVRELVAEEVTGGDEVAEQEGEETITINESVIADILGEVFEGLEENLDEQSLDEEEDPTPADPNWDPTTLTPKERGRPAPKPGKVKTSKKSPEAPVPMEEALHQQLQAYEQNYAQLYESHQAYEHNYAQLYQEAGQLHEQNNKFRQMLVKTQEKLNEVNVRNAQLHYTNRTLNSDSLNERQKDKVVEAIKKAGTVEEAKIIFETLQSAVAGARPIREAPKSLNEAINERSSAFLPRKEEKQSDPSFADRMQRLAGIK
jgi:hypothetical protein